MKKFAMMMMACCMPMMMMAQSVQYCMTYGDYKAGHWTAVDDLVGGRTEQMPQIKWDDTEYKIKTGDKEADKKLKKEVLAIKAGKQIYVNCRNLREDDVILDCSNYVQGYQYDGDKLIVAVYHINDGAMSSIPRLMRRAAIPSPASMMSIWRSCLPMMLICSPATRLSARRESASLPPTCWPS